MPHHGMEQGMGMMAGGLMMLSLLAFTAAVIGTLWLLRRKGLLPGLDRLTAVTGRPVSTRPDDAESYLDMRLARGEIDVDEYYERRSALREGRMIRP